MKKLNFGCGPDIKKGWDNCDIQEGKEVISFDANKFPYNKLRDNYYDYIYIRETLEILNEPDKVLLELWKKTKKDGIIEIEVPYHNNKGAVNDLQVKHFFNDEVFRIFVEQICVINKNKKFEIREIKLKPTKVGRFIPKVIRERILPIFIGGIISKVNVKLRAIK